MGGKSVGDEFGSVLLDWYSAKLGFALGGLEKFGFKGDG